MLSTELAYAYTLYSIIILILQLSVRPSRKVTGSYLTRVKNHAFFASVSFDVTEAVDGNS